MPIIWNIETYIYQLYLLSLPANFKQNFKHEFVQEGEGGQQPLGPENSLKSKDVTDPL